MWMYDDKKFKSRDACLDWMMCNADRQGLEEVVFHYLHEVYNGRYEDLLSDISALYFKDCSMRDFIRNAQDYCEEAVGTKEDTFGFGRMVYSNKKLGELHTTFYYKGEKVADSVKDAMEYFKGDEYRELRASVAMAGLHREYYGRWDELVREIAYGTLCTNEVAQFRHALILLTEGLTKEGDYDEYLGIPLRCQMTYE